MAGDIEERQAASEIDWMHMLAFIPGVPDELALVLQGLIVALFGAKRPRGHLKEAVKSTGRALGLGHTPIQQRPDVVATGPTEYVAVVGSEPLVMGPEDDEEREEVRIGFNQPG